ncbi:MAG: NAD-dependent epimerase/dehydratase family protein [Patescibacteria group bacterium]|jgi:UDP-glucuronate decarboxylase
MAGKNTIKKSALTPTVVVAGGAGFIGSRLSEVLLTKGARVVVLDNFRTGRKNQVEHLLANPNFALFDVNINNGIPPEIESADYVFHLAALESYKSAEKNADLESLLTNAVGTRNLLDFTKNCSGKFLLASSIDVYQGQLSPLELTKYFGHTEEEENKFELAEARRFAEAMVWEYFKNYDADARIVRLPEIYGPKMDEDSGGELGSLMQEVARSNSLTIKGEGLSKEYYLYIEDAVNGLIKALLNQNTKGKIFTLVEKEPYTPLEIAYMLKTLANQQVEIKFDKDAKVRARNLASPDTSNHPLLKWGARTGFKEGIKKTLESMGYETNESSFKLDKLIEKKAKEVQAKPVQSNEAAIMTLQDLKPEVENEEIKRIKKPFGLGSKLKSIFRSGGSKPKTYVKEINPSKENVTNIGATAPLVTFSKSKTINFAEDIKVLGGSTGKPKKTSPTKSTFTCVVAGVVSAFLAATLVFIGLPILQTWAYSRSAMASLEKMPTTLAQLQSEQGKTQANEAFQNFYKARNSFSRLKWIYGVLHKRAEYNSVIKLMSSATYFSEAMYNVSKAIIPFTNIWDIINPNSDQKLSAESFSQAKLDLGTAGNSINLASAEYKSVVLEALPGSFATKASDYGRVLGSITQRFGEANTYIEDVSDLLGVSAPKRYLVLLQNSNEIRPTGGFIGSYAVLEIDKGKITNLEINDIYNPDGQLDTRNISVVPPKPISDFLKEDKLHIRNANWDPNFTETAQVIQDLFFRIDGQTFDGVIGMDLDFSKKVMELTGPVFLTSYNEEITSENLEEKAQFYSEFNYEEGVSQKKSFLSMLTSKMLEKMFALPREKMPELLSGIQTMLNERHLMLYVPDTMVSTLLKERKWDGDMVAVQDSDYLYIVNANLGGTKSNYYVKNTYSYKVSSDTRDGVLRAELTMNFTNSDETGAWPGGPYTDYLRVFIGKGSKLTGATLGDKNIFKEVLVTEGAHTVFESSFKVNPKENLTLILRYDLPTELSLEKDVRSYSLYWQKQAGAKNDPAVFEFVPPMGLEVIGGTSKYETILNKDWVVDLALK